MITAQDIREKTFEKAKFGGYDMASVDEFLEELADEITAAQKENAVMKSKMKVLVDKIEEYRSNEEALNQAVISAQKLAVQIEADARTRSAAMLAEAEQKVKEQVGGIADMSAEQEKRLADAKAATRKFCDGIRAMCAAQMKNLDTIENGIITKPEAPKAAGIKAVDETVRSIENSVARIQPEAPVAIDLSDEIDAPVQPRSLDSTQPFTL